MHVDPRPALVRVPKVFRQRKLEKKKKINVYFLKTIMLKIIETPVKCESNSQC